MSDFWTRVKTAAETAKLDLNAYRVWKHRGWVPAKNHKYLVAAAKKAGIKLSYEDLNKTIQ